VKQRHFERITIKFCDTYLYLWNNCSSMPFNYKMLFLSIDTSFFV
jgi:hypothetical protein